MAPRKNKKTSLELFGLFQRAGADLSPSPFFRSRSCIHSTLKKEGRTYEADSSLSSLFRS